jgi:hypothetical protein
MIESTLKSRCGAESWTDVSLLDTYWPLKSQLRTGRENVHAAIFNTTAFILLVPCLTRDRAARIKKKRKTLMKLNDEVIFSPVNSLKMSP